MRLIDADELLEMYSYENDCGLSPDEWDQLRVPVGVLRQNIADIRTVDAVPVVRCKDCIHWFDNGTDYCSCEVDALLREANHFCSYGERRADNVQITD